MASWFARLAVLAFFFAASACAQLTPTYYDKICPTALSIIKSRIKKVLSNESRMGASILRLHFHDCFVHGCDGSVLLDGTSSEKTAPPNLHSVRGFKTIDSIKRDLEAACSGVVSCADILAVAARDSVEQLGGPTWTVMLGRRDSKTSYSSLANSNLPPPTSNLTNLISIFQARGFSTKDMVALSGAHTIGQARCTVFRSRIYNDTTIDSCYAQSLQSICPSGKTGNRNLSPLDEISPTVFDNGYYKNLIKKRGLFRSDQELFNGGCTDSLVSQYATNANAFFKDFASAMVKMGKIQPLLGRSGEVRKNCRKPN